MRAAVSAWITEYRRIFTDSGVLLVFFGASVLYSFLYPLPYLPEVLRDISIAVVDEDHTQMSRQLRRMIDAHEYMAVPLEPETLAAAQQAYRRKEVDGIIVIPRDFQRRVFRGEQVGIAAYYDTSTFLHYRQLRTGVTQVARTFGAGIEIKRLRAGGYSQEKAMAARDPVTLTASPVFNPSGGYATYVVPAVFVLLLQQTLWVSMGMVSGTQRERRSPAAKRVRLGGAVASVTGKTGAYVSLHFLNTLYYVVLLKVYYGFSPRTDPVTALVFLIPFLLSLAFIGITLAPLFTNRETAICVYLVSSLPVLFLSGFAWPREAMPEWLRAVSYAAPTTAGIDGFLRITQMGASLHDVAFAWRALWILAGASFVTAWLSTWGFGRESETG